MTISEENNKSIKDLYMSKNIELETFTDHIIKDSAEDQLKNITDIPGVQKVVILPDVHGGYYFPIGCVVGIEDYIVPEGVGNDINCGVRILRTNVNYSEFIKVKEEIGHKIKSVIPSGLYDKNSKKSEDGFLSSINLEILNKILDEGCNVLKEYGIDNKYIENYGSLSGNSRIISQKAKNKGINELGSLGGGNHFLEIQKLDKIYNKEIADKLNMKEDEIFIMIHTGSRGVGHQILEDFKKESSNNFLDINSEEGKKYLKMMNSAANFAFVNRAVISERVKNIFEEYFNKEITLIYDVSHNIATIEEIEIKNTIKSLVVHRKGAATAYPPSNLLPEPYNIIGQPIPIGGSMGTASYLLVSNKTDKSLFSCAHGAGRIISRKEAKRKFTVEEIQKYLEDKNITVITDNKKEIIEEAPQNYKDIDKVVEELEEREITKKICKMIPLLVIKG